MTLLSKVIKGARFSRQAGRTIRIRTLEKPAPGEQKTDLLPEPADVEPAIDWEETRKKAEAILSEAKREAQRMKEEAERERQKMMEEIGQIAERAKKEGYEEGRLLGRQAGYAEAAKSIAEAKETVDLAKKDYFSHIEQSEKTILAIGLAVAEKILNMKIEENPENFLPLVKKAIQEAKEYREVRVIVHYKMYPLVLEQKEELRSLYFQNGELLIYPSDEVPETGCIIETEGGRIDASVDAQLMEIREKLLKIADGG